MSDLNLVKNMRELRTFNRYSQQYVSDQILIARQTYSLYETGKRLPDLKTVCSLAQLYHVSVDALLYLDLTESQLADATPDRHSAILPDSSLIRLNGADARMLTNYKELPADTQRECREFVLFKKKLFSAKEK